MLHPETGNRIRRVPTDPETDPVERCDIDKGYEIDRLYWNDPFFLVPEGEMAIEAIAVIREAMRGRVAFGRLTMPGVGD